MSQISEIELVDSYYTLNISELYARKPDRFDKGILLVFANFGLKIVGFGSEAYKTIKKRYKRVLDQIKDNKKNSKAQHYNFDSEKLFFSASEFPNLCKKDSPKR